MGVKRIYLQQNVLEAARERIRFVFEEFQHVYVSFSGGKDSTVVLNLALEIAEAMGRLPLPVLFIDQEAEWQATIDYVRQAMDDPRVDARWLQVPIKLFNATSTIDPWLQCWDPKAEGQWIRPKEPDSYHRNVYGTDRFKYLFTSYLQYHHASKPVASLTGMRCEESPGRTLGLTGGETYKGVTWGGYSDAKRHHYVFSPIYDWSYTDVWKAIHDFGWAYCRLYDSMYQYGVPVMQMRVSNLHHETATRSLYYLQEIEPDTWNRVTQRLSGINTMGQMRSDFFAPKDLPPMFADWVEYRDYLLENLITSLDRETFRKQFARLDRDYAEDDDRVKGLLLHTEIQAVLLNDTFMTIIGNFTSAHLPAKRRNAREARRLEQAEAGGGA